MDISHRVIARLHQWMSEEQQRLLQKITVSDKAEQIGFINEIETAIKRLELCEKYQIYGGAKILVMPEEYSSSVSYYLISDNESSKPENWTILTDEQCSDFVMQSGDLAIRR